LVAGCQGHVWSVDDCLFKGVDWVQAK